MDQVEICELLTNEEPAPNVELRGSVSTSPFTGGTLT